LSFILNTSYIFELQKIILTLLFLHIALSHQEEDVGAKESVVNDADGGVKDDEAVSDKDDDGRVRVKVPVKRLHSRHRRYIAPGDNFTNVFMSSFFVYESIASIFSYTCKITFC
jgi:hypothetical protein